MFNFPCRKCSILNISSNVNMVLISLHFRYRAVPSSFYRKTSGALIVYDITQKVTYENVGHWLKDLRGHTHDKPIVVMLVGNKADLSHLRAVSKDDAKAFSEKEKFLFMETSALNALNVETAFTTLLVEIYLVKNGKTHGKDLAFVPQEQSIDKGVKDDQAFEKEFSYKTDDASSKIDVKSHGCSHDQEV